MRMLTCKQAEKMVMPYIDGRLDEEELDTGTGVYDITGALGESMDLSWMKVRAVRLRKVVCYAVNTLVTVSILVMLAMQLRIWIG